VNIVYRARQFWFALTALPSEVELQEISRVLSPAQITLFLRLDPGEQVHSIKIYRQLCEQSQANRDLQNRDLWVAALLHDVGKSRYPLRLWERVEIVIVKRLAPGKIKKWGKSAPSGWKRPFVVAEQHAAWGAQMAAQAGASSLAVSLICRHQEPMLRLGEGRFAGRQAALYEDFLLYHLQQVDNQS
jgi:hypothetical protein